MIILLGLPKSGTTSFQKLFSNLGYKSIHHMYENNKFVGSKMKWNLLNNRPLLKSFENYDCITQMDVCLSHIHCFWPQITHYKQIYEENPDSIFILNKRNIDKIVLSFQKWNKYDERMMKYNPELFENVRGANNEEKLKTLFKEHYDNIEDFFSCKENAKFISYDIDNDNIEKLSKYIDLKGSLDFPHENKNSENNI